MLRRPLLLSFLLLTAGFVSGCQQASDSPNEKSGDASSGAILSLGEPRKFNINLESLSFTRTSIALADARAVKVYPGSTGGVTVVFGQIPQSVTFDVLASFEGQSFRYSVSNVDRNAASFGQFELPYRFSTNACAGLDETTYSVTGALSLIVNNRQISSSTPIRFYLDCSSQAHFTGEGSFCAYNYTESACESLIEFQSNIGTWTFNPGPGKEACDLFPVYDHYYDYDYSEDEFNGPVGACIWAPTFP
jgi:hypothetical protein